MKTKSFSLNIPVAKDKRLETKLPKGTFKITLDYPLCNPHAFTIQGNQTLFSVIGLIIDEYHMIYKNPTKFGIYGHDIGDLVIEKIKVDYIKNIITVGIGS